MTSPGGRLPRSIQKNSKGSHKCQQKFHLTEFFTAINIDNSMFFLLHLSHLVIYYFSTTRYNST